MILNSGIKFIKMESPITAQEMLYYVKQNPDTLIKSMLGLNGELMLNDVKVILIMGINDKLASKIDTHKNSLAEFDFIDVRYIPEEMSYFVGIKASIKIWTDIMVKDEKEIYRDIKECVMDSIIIYQWDIPILFDILISIATGISIERLREIRIVKKRNV